MCFGGKKKEEPVAAAEVKEEEVVKEAEKTEAVKVEEVKEAAMLEKADTFTAPVSTLDKDSIERKRQKELSTGVEAPLTGNALAGTMTSLIGGMEGKSSGTFKGPDAEAPKRKQKQMDTISALSKKRSKGKGRRSLITGTSGGGIGYYNKYFT
tara:strand:- start:584 stop:1042 length:459 start_codon:yes stop_codon:yes gene_type:complete